MLSSALRADKKEAELSAWFIQHDLGNNTIRQTFILARWPSQSIKTFIERGPDKQYKLRSISERITLYNFSSSRISL